MVKDKYDLLWNYLVENCLGTLLLSFKDIYNISGVIVNSAFMDRKHDCERHGIEITKINLKDETVLFSRFTTRNKHIRY